jgi:hypothetical protein
MFKRNAKSIARWMLLGGFFAGSCLVSAAAQTPAAPAKPTVTAASNRFRPDPFAGRAATYYRLVWGIESPSVRTAESGEIVRFTYRVIDPRKASQLNDKKFEPSLIDPQAGVKLVVPSLEQVGQLRQSAPPEPGKVYWMAFSNSGRVVKHGDHVNIVIGQFHADGLLVE